MSQGTDHTERFVRRFDRYHRISHGLLMASFLGLAGTGLPLIFSEDSLDAMCRLRDVFDPDHRANPGKVVPMRSCREWAGTPAVRQAEALQAEALQAEAPRAKALHGG